MLQHDEIALALRVSHELLKLAAERVKEVARSRHDLIRREQANPAQAGDDARPLGGVREVRQGFNSGDYRAGIDRRRMLELL